MHLWLALSAVYHPEIGKYQAGSCLTGLRWQWTVSDFCAVVAVAPDSYWNYVRANGRYSTSTLQSTEDCMPVPRLTYHIGGFGSDIKDQFISHLDIDHQLPPKHLAIVLTN